MKIIMYASVLLILFCNILSPAGSAAHGGIPIGTQWEVEGANIFKNEGTFVRIPARIGDVLGGVSGGTAGIIIGLPVGAIATLFTGEPVCLILFPIAGNAFVGLAGRVTGSSVFGAPFYVIAKIYQHISVAVNEAIFYSDIMNKYFRS